MYVGNFLALVTTLSFLVYIPILSYLDWKYRDIKTHLIWMPLVAVNTPILIAGYYLGIYPVTLAIISAIGIVLWGALLMRGILPGGDFAFLSIVSLFMILNPISGNPFMLMFSFYLIGMSAATMFGIILDKKLHHEKIDLHMVLNFPYMVTFSCAFIIAVVMG